MKAEILVVEDESHLRKVLEAMLKKGGYNVTTVADGETALQLAEERIFDLVLCDIRLSKSNGIEVLKAFKRIHPDTAVVMMTAYPSTDSVIQALREGADDYLLKPINYDELLIVVDRIIEQKRLIHEYDRIRREVDKTYDFSNIIGISKAIREVLEMVKKVADTNSAVLIYGESGTGKELIAKAIHYNSPRRDKPLIAINCAAVPSEMLESEFFGHTKGAFTGATSVKKGLLEEADGSTLFLDEIGELPLELQPKLLRAIETGEVRRVGENQPRSVNFRLIASTNRDLEANVQSGAFRADLYYRLRVIYIHLPPLRERKEDIPILADHLLHKLAEKHKKKVKRVSTEAINCLMRYHWPGNVRELEHVIEQTIILASNEVISAEDLPQSIRKYGSATDIPLPEGELNLRKALDGISQEAERAIIIRALELSNHNHTRAAELLGISRRTLLYKLKEYGIASNSQSSF